MARGATKHLMIASHKPGRFPLGLRQHGAVVPHTARARAGSEAATTSVLLVSFQEEARLFLCFFFVPPALSFLLSFAFPVIQCGGSVEHKTAAWVCQGGDGAVLGRPEGVATSN